MITADAFAQGQEVEINGSRYIVIQSIGGNMVLAVRTTDDLPVAPVYVVELPA